MAIRPDWSDWEPWSKLWEEWVRMYKGEKNINLEHIQFVDLFNFFRRQVKALALDPRTIDVKSFIDGKLTYEENKKILSEILGAPPTTEEYASMYESYKHELMGQVEEKYPEVVAEFRKKIEELEKEAEGFPKVERERAKFKNLSEKLRYELEETIRRHEEEKEALERKVAPVKLRIVKAFSEGIIDYTVGSVVETRDIDWALGLIEKGLAERVAVEVPVEVKPRPPEVPPEVKLPPKHKYLTDEEVGRLWEEFVAYARLKGLKEPTVYRERFMLEIKTAKDYETASRRSRKLVDAILEELKPPPVRPPVPPRVVTEKIAIPPGWKKVVNGYLTPGGVFISEEDFPTLMRKFEPWRRLVPPPSAPGLHIRDWLRWKYGLDWGDFLKLTDEERKILQDEYIKESEERK